MNRGIKLQTPVKSSYFLKHQKSGTAHNCRNISDVGAWNLNVLFLGYVVLWRLSNVHFCDTSSIIIVQCV